MSMKETSEETSQKNALKIRELSLRLEELDRAYQGLLDELGVTPEQLKAHVENPDNFSDAIRDALEQEKKQLDEKLDLALSRLRNPKKTKKTFSEQAFIQPHWLFVR